MSLLNFRSRKTKMKDDEHKHDFPILVYIEVIVNYVNIHRFRNILYRSLLNMYPNNFGTESC